MEGEETGWGKGRIVIRYFSVKSGDPGLPLHHGCRRARYLGPQEREEAGDAMGAAVDECLRFLSTPSFFHIFPSWNRLTRMAAFVFSFVHSLSFHWRQLHICYRPRRRVRKLQQDGWKTDVGPCESP